MAAYVPSDAGFGGHEVIEEAMIRCRRYVSPTNDGKRDREWHVPTTPDPPNIGHASAI
jgi:hypothetical protein